MKFKIILLLLAIVARLNAQKPAVNITTIEYAYPSWCLNNQIVFQSNLYGTWDIFIMNDDGTGKRRLTQRSGENITPAVSPDGKRIAFVSDRDGDEDIYIMGLDGVILDKVTNNNITDYHPAWSPDGKKITYGSGATEGETEIYEMDLLTREITRITTNNQFDSFSSYSPDGKTIVWIKWFENNNGELFTIDLSTKVEKQLTHTDFFEGYPSWSRDGKYVYYGFPNPQSRKYDIERISVDNLKIERVFTSAYHDRRQQESPDGKRLVFNREDEDGIYISIIDIEK